MTFNRALFFSHNAVIVRARDDYAAYPNRACYYATCFELCDDGLHWCRSHCNPNQRRRKA